MKRTVLAMAVGMAGGLAALTSAQGQGVVQLDNYASSGNIISFGAGAGSGPIQAGFTIGLYYAAGSVVGSVPADPTGTAIPGGPLALGTGANSTTPSVTANGGGYFAATGNFTVPGVTAGNPGTFEIIAYNGASYAAASVRGHSAAFAMNVGSGSPIVAVGSFMPAFSVFNVSAVPEPTTFAFAGLAGASLLLFRRRK